MGPEGVGGGITHKSFQGVYQRLMKRLRLKIPRTNSQCLNMAQKLVFGTFWVLLGALRELVEEGFLLNLNRGSMRGY